MQNNIPVDGRAPKISKNMHVTELSCMYQEILLDELSLKVVFVQAVICRGVVPNLLGSWRFRGGSSTRQTGFSMVVKLF